MTPSEFTHNASHYIFKEVAKNVNMLCGLSKTSSMIANLFANLPLQVETRYIEEQPKPSKKLNALDDAILASWVRNGIISFINIHIKSLNNLQNLMNLLYQRNN